MNLFTGVKDLQLHPDPALPKPQRRWVWTIKKFFFFIFRFLLEYS